MVEYGVDITMLFRSNFQLFATLVPLNPIYFSFEIIFRPSFIILYPHFLELSEQISNHLELIKPNPRDDPDKQRKDTEFAAAVFGKDIDLVGGHTQNKSFLGLSNVEHCGKMRALEKLMSSWVSQGDKILLFSYSVRYYISIQYFYPFE